MNLRSLNPFVASSFVDWNKKNSLQAHAPRVRGPLPGFKTTTKSECSGASSFGMSGVNAYAIFENGESVLIYGDITNLQSKRNWILAPNYILACETVELPAKINDTAVFSFLRSWHDPRISFLYDHILKEKPVLPATAMVESSLASAITLLHGQSNGDICLVDTSISALALLPSKEMKVSISCIIDYMSGRAQISSNNNIKTLHFVSVIQAMLTENATRANVIKYTEGREIIAGIYNRGADFNVPSFSGFQEITSAQKNNFIIYPALSDANLHLLGIGNNALENDALVIPVSIGTVNPISKNIIGNYGCAKADYMDGNCNCLLFDYLLINALEVKAMTSVDKVTDSKTENRGIVDFLYTAEWQACEVIEDTRQKEGNIHPINWSAGNNPSKSVSDALTEIQIAFKSADNIDVLSIVLENAPSVNPTPSPLVDPLKASTAGGLFGLSKVSAMENSILSTSYVQRSSLSNSEQRKEVHSMRDAFGTADEGGAILKAKLERLPNGIPGRSRLLPEPRGSILNMKLVPYKARTLNDNDICITVKSIGLNFRDLLNVLNMYPGNPGPPGGDCSGVIKAVGTLVTEFRKGDSIFGLVPGCIGPEVVSSDCCIVEKPSSCTYSEAAAIPTVYVTGLLALKLCPENSKILIHSGTGGVGQAFISLAKAFGREVVATAGNSLKRRTLRQQSITGVLNSRDTSWVEDLALIEKITLLHNEDSINSGTYGSVLNSLTSSGMIAASLSLLRRGGSFIEIGKRDIWGYQRVAQERSDIGHHIVAIDMLPSRSLKRKLRTIARLITTGDVSTSYATFFSLGEAATALRRYAKALHVGKLILNSTSNESAESSSWFSRETILISGGNGALGSLTADWLGGRGEAYLVLLGRSRGAVGHFLERGRWLVSQISCDTSTQTSTKDLANMLIADNLPEVTTIYHCAGVLRDGLLPSQSPSDIRRVFGPKSTSSLSMMKTFRKHPLRQLVLFSSAASLFGSPGQANYSSANAALEAHAFAVSENGINARVIQWGAWEVGMAANDLTSQRAKRTGLRLLTAEQGIDSLRTLLLDKRRIIRMQVLVAAVLVDWDRLFMGSSVPHFFSEMQNNYHSASSHQSRNSMKARRLPSREYNQSREQQFNNMMHDISSAISEILLNLTGTSILANEPLRQAGIDSLSAVEFRNALNRRFGIGLPATIMFDYGNIAELSMYISKLISKQDSNGYSEHILEKNAVFSQPRYQQNMHLMKLSLSDIRSRLSETINFILDSDIEPEAPLMTNGLDSLGIVELRNKLTKEFGFNFSPTVFMDYPTINSLATHILASLRASEETNSREEMANASIRNPIQVASAQPNELIVFLVKSASRMPKETSFVDSDDSVTRVPIQRWDSESPNNAKAPRFGSFVNNIDLFDEFAFMLNRAESLWIDPQQRMLMENSAELVPYLVSQNVAVMVGIGTSDYVETTTSVPLETYFATGNADSVASGRISFVHGLTGPCLSIDTACSSSLVATHYSLREMKHNVFEEALAAGVNTILSPRKAAAFNVTGMLAPDGRCKTLDSTADGYVRAETCVVHLLSSSQKYPNEEYSVDNNISLAGSAINQDGRSSALTAPNGLAQQSVLCLALSSACNESSDICGLELHGTGTLLGDPVEVGAAASVFCSNMLKAPLMLNSTKSRLGHAETGAGSLGVLTVVSQLKERYARQITHLKATNSFVNELLKQEQRKIMASRLTSPLITNETNISTLQSISSFAFQGTNANIILNATESHLDYQTNVKMFWQQKKFWIVKLQESVIYPSHLRFLNETVQFHCDLLKARTSFLKDFSLSGNHCLPTTVYLEVSASISNTMLNKDRLALHHAVWNMDCQNIKEFRADISILHQNIEIFPMDNAFGKPILFSSFISNVPDLGSTTGNTNAIRLSRTRKFTMIDLQRMPVGSFAMACLNDLADVACLTKVGICEAAAALRSCINEEKNYSKGCDLILLSSLRVDNVPHSISSFIREANSDIQSGDGKILKFMSLQFEHPTQKLIGEQQGEFSVLYRRKRLSSTKLSSGKWLLLGLEDGLSRTVCNFSPQDAIFAIGIRHNSCTRDSRDLRIVFDTEIVTSSMKHLHWILQNVLVDHVIGICSKNPDEIEQQDFNSYYMSSLAWAHTAHKCSGNNAKMSTIAYDHGSSADEMFEPRPGKLSAAAISIAKTRYMEDHKTQGIAILLNVNEIITTKELQWLLSECQESFVVIRNKEMLVERLIATTSVPRKRATTLSSCTVIFGGSRGLGLAYALHISQKGYQNLVLASKSGKISEESLNKLTVSGTKIFIKKCDSACRQDCAKMFQWLYEEMPVVETFAFASGIIDFHLIPDITKESFWKVMGPKAAVASIFSVGSFPAATPLFFSSVSSIWSQRGSSSYSAGNSFQNAISKSRQSSGLPGTALILGPVSSVGMTNNLE